LRAVPPAGLKWLEEFLWLPRCVAKVKLCQFASGKSLPQEHSGVALDKRGRDFLFRLLHLHPALFVG
jgi:hypothetical protein